MRVFVRHKQVLGGQGIWLDSNDRELVDADDVLAMTARHRWLVRAGVMVAVLVATAISPAVVYIVSREFAYTGTALAGSLCVICTCGPLLWYGAHRSRKKAAATLTRAVQEGRAFLVNDRLYITLDLKLVQQSGGQRIEDLGPGFDGVVAFALLKFHELGRKIADVLDAGIEDERVKTRKERELEAFSILPVTLIITAINIFGLAADEGQAPV